MTLLDTHVLLWLAREPEKLSSRAASAIRAAHQSGGLGIADITLWEIAWLAAHGRLTFTGTLDAFMEAIASKTTVFPISPKAAALANQFPASYSSDPADRLIGATALAEGLALVTKDRNIRNFKQIHTIW